MNEENKNQETEAAAEKEQIQVEESAQTTESSASEQPNETEAAAEKEAKPRSRDLIVERYRQTLPEGEEYAGDNDDVLYDYAERTISSLSDKGKKYDDFTKKVMDRLSEDPEGMMAFMDYIDGKSSYPAALRKYKGDEALSIKEGDEGWEEYEKAGKEHAEQVNKNLELAKQLKANADESERLFAEFVKAQGWDDEQAKKFWDYLYSDAQKFAMGKYDNDLFDRYKRSFDYEKDIAGAKEAGKAEAENKKIEVLRKNMKGSGLQNDIHGNGDASTEVEEKTPKNRTAEWLDGFRHRG